MFCPVCLINPVKRHSIYGVLLCFPCEERRKTQSSPDSPIEFTSKSIKSERKEYSKDIVQPFRGNEASKEFLDAYPEKAKKTFTEKEIKTIRNVWK